MKAPNVTEARTIHDVIRIIDDITAKAMVEEDRVGYFAALYRHVAVRFAWAIARKEFEHPALMENLDVVFFNRYLTALTSWKEHRSCARSWEVAFRVTDDPTLAVIQHLLVGMNAHINFDLGIATAEAVPRDELAAFQKDFDRMNELLASLVNGVLNDLSTVWPLLKLFNALFLRDVDKFVDFSMEEARKFAWDNALRVSRAGTIERPLIEHEIDIVTSDIGRPIADPPFPLSTLMAWVQHGEQGTVSQIIRDLLAGSGEPPPRALLDAVQAEAAPELVSERPARQRRRVVVLGAGQSAMTAAFQLTHPKNPRAKDYDVTVYQLGWRLGGKGATGRNADFSYRIEEHGLHNWFGFYDNCFRQIQDCYAELGRAPDEPLATWQQAFHPANQAVFTEEINGEHLFWVITNPPNKATPGTGALFLPLWEYALMAIEAIESLFKTTRHPRFMEVPPTEDERAALRAGQLLGAPDGGPTVGHDLLAAALHVGHMGKSSADPPAILPEHMNELQRLIAWAEHEVELAEVPAEKAAKHVACSILKAFMEWLWRCIEPVVWTDTDARRLWILANFGYAIVTGCLRCGVIEGGFDVINDQNFRPWLARFAIPDGGVMLDSPVVRAVYDSSFAYVDGDTTVPPGQKYPPKEAFEAGTALRGMVRATFTYKGSFGYRFAAGTADTCYAPMYLVMKKRGVAFRFFHQVVEVVHDENAPGRPIQRIRIIEQVAITDEQKARGGYDPLIEVKGLPCWPSTPRWDQIVGGDPGVNLECPPQGFRGVREIVLERGRDFDDVVLGISIAALPWICPAIIAASHRWQEATQKVKTVRTQALQLWLRRTSTEMGFPITGAPIASWDYDRTNSLNVWGDLTELLPFEGWPVDPYPLNLGYYTSPLPDTPVPPPDAPLPPCYDCEAQASAVRENAIRLLDSGMFIPWPRATHETAERRAFDWDLLVDLRSGVHVGPSRIDSQFFKANVALTERYVLSVPGSSQHRLQVHDDHEFTNLYLAGDWTWCGLNCGAMESATMSGMLCSNALSGFPARKDITGVDFGH
ncbi:MAG: NAD(P)-binding protein [Polyangiaceae bacterium]|nr:NAD(P)-binding protein [Polyangiaceae bacterium]